MVKPLRSTKGERSEPISIENAEPGGKGIKPLPLFSLASMYFKPLTLYSQNYSVFTIKRSYWESNPA